MSLLQQKDLEDKLEEINSSIYNNKYCLFKQLIKLNNAQRIQIKSEYTKKYNQNIIEIIVNKLGDEYKDYLDCLFTPSIDYDTEEIKNSLSSLEVDYESLIEIICIRKKYILEEIKQKYLQKYSQSIEEALNNSRKSIIIEILLLILKGLRSENIYPNETQCASIADELNKDINSISPFNINNILKYYILRSENEINLISKIYAKKYNENIIEEIMKKFDIESDRKNFKSLLYAISCPAKYFAFKIKKILSDYNDNFTWFKLFKIFISRSDLDITLINKYYEILNKTKFFDDITNDCQDDMNNILFNFINY